MSGNNGAVYLIPMTFGFGPASLASAVARALRASDATPRLLGVADGIAAEFLAGTGLFDEIITAPPGELPESFGSAPGPSVAVAFGDFDRPPKAKRLGIPVIVVDALYWMWDREPLDPAGVDRYLCLAFPGVQERVDARGVGSMRVIAQILDDALPPPAGERSGALLNLGGAVAPFGSNHAFLGALVTTVADALGGTDLLVTCSAPACDALRETGLPQGVRVAALPFPEMMRALAERAVLLTVPGLSIMWEALRMRVPTVVLPGSNYSQHRQVVAYQQFFADTPVINWDAFPGYGALPAGLSERDGVARAVALGDRFAGDDVARKGLAESLRGLLGSEVPAPRLTPGSPWSSFAGARQVSTEVTALLDSIGAVT